MSLFDKFQSIASVRQDLDELGIVPFGVVTERLLSATEGIVNGRRTILAGTNNYLGLTFHPECIETARTAVTEEGTGTTGSRMANGTYAGHVALERELAAFFGCEQAIVFSTGYQANLGMIATLAGPGDVVVYRLSYDWNIMIPLFEPIFGETVTLQANVAVRNEPFG